MEGTEIQAVSKEKDLGVVVDDKLRFSRRIAAAAACANRKLGLLKHTNRRVLHPGLYPDT